MAGLLCLRSPGVRGHHCPRNAVGEKRERRQRPGFGCSARHRRHPELFAEGGVACRVQPC
eukprot:5273181-Lingulodinium_polyedra.AAC.1